MIIGHYAPAFVAKSVDKTIPLLLLCWFSFYSVFFREPSEVF